MSDLRGLLEEIAYGEDPGISIDHRLRAAEQLRALGVGDVESGLRDLAWLDLADMDDDEIDAWSDCAAASVFSSSSDDERRQRFPELMRVVVAEVERRVAERVDETVRAAARNGG